MKKIAVALLFLIGIGSAQAAPVPNQPIWTQTGKEAIGVIVNGSGTSPVTLYAGGASGSKIVSITCSSTDTVGHTLQLSILHSATTYLLTTQTITANAGNATATLPQPLLTQAAFQNGLAVDGNGNPYIFVNSGDTLQIGVITTAVTTSDQIACMATIGDF